MRPPITTLKNSIFKNYAAIRPYPSQIPNSATKRVVPQPVKLVTNLLITFISVDLPQKTKSPNNKNEKPVEKKIVGSSGEVQLRGTP